MTPDLTFIFGLLDADSLASASQEDLSGEHAAMLRLWQRLGFLAREPGRHPVPSCPHCKEGVPYLLGSRYICDDCRSDIDPRHLLLWRFDLVTFLRWLARRLRLAGNIRQVEDRLWQLGRCSHG